MRPLNYKISVKLKNCSNSSNNDRVEYSYKIFSIKDKQPMFETYVTSVDFQENPNFERFAVYNVAYPNRSYVANYEWQIPVGWRIDDVVSSGTNWIRGRRSETLWPDQTRGGTVKVRAVNDKCVGQAPSKPITVNVSRKLPSSTKVNFSGEQRRGFGDKNSTQFSVPQWSFATYLWMPPVGWSVTGGSVNSNTVSLRPDGCNDGTVAVRISVPSGGFTQDFSQTIQYELTSASETYPSLSPIEAICQGSSTKATINNVPSNTTITWQPGDLTILYSGQGNSNAYFRPKNSSSIGRETISVDLSRGGCPAEPFSTTTTVGKPEDFSFDGIQGDMFLSVNSPEYYQYSIPFEKIHEQGYTYYYWSVSPASKLQIMGSHI